ncbi:hypothetical protein D3Z30_11715 [Staphylococcus warneri]|uniref:XRE family transcriptional regulator n=1 Tax=Staphylococcus warneri TaxID=1292 RepID=A0AB36BJ77_STAWA|nr:hypothetical protein [Staphylococcus warneri]
MEYRNLENLKETLLEHAQELLKGLRNSEYTVQEISESSGIHQQQIYAYKDNRRNINNARFETLIKFENAYIYINNKQN